MDSTSGPTGTIITVTGGGFAASRQGYVYFDSDGDDVRDTGEPYQFPLTTSTGALPAGVTLTVPAVASGTYDVIANIPTATPLVDASATFTVTIGAPSISLDPASGTIDTVITITGNGFNGSADGWVWFDTNGDSIRDDEESQVPVTTTASGTIPADTTLTAPAMAPIASYAVCADIPEGDIVESYASFSNTSSTTMWLTVTKYDAYGQVLDTETITYEEMEENLPVQGDTSTHRYHQGPTFDDTDFDLLWDPGETENIDSRDYGAAMGTNVKDLCDLVGGASPGDTIKIKASDNFAKWFDYEDIYNPEPEQGKMVVTWYTTGTADGLGGYVPDYSAGLRLVFFAQTLNSEGKYVFGDWDMHETLAESRWHYYYDGKFWPSSSGLSVKYVRYIEVYSNGGTEKASDSLIARANVTLGALGIALDRDSIDFGDIRPGKSSEVAEVIITNIGTLDCDVTLEVQGTDDIAQDFYEKSLYVDATLYNIDDVIASIQVNDSQSVSTQLKIPADWGESGVQEATFIFWATASD